MLKIKRKFFNEIWFAEEIKENYRILPVIYRQYLGSENKNVLFRKKFTTLVIDLEQSLEEIYNKFSKETKYEIRRAEKEKVKFEIENNKFSFKEEYNKNAINLGITPISKERLESFDENILITKAKIMNRIICYHAYLVDQNRVRLLYSSRKKDQDIENKIYGFANRYLHYQDIIFFKKIGKKYYDFGGISKSEVQKLKNIDKFKLAFGGKEVIQPTYMNLSMKILLFLKGGLK